MGEISIKTAWEIWERIVKIKYGKYQHNDNMGKVSLRLNGKRQHDDNKEKVSIETKNIKTLKGQNRPNMEKFSKDKKGKR